ncbi:MAG: hypothetical protein KJ799_15435 [Bacteroidetes bacterium]|nr:hypothetical protein [Bacteroidota bacterium]MBU1679581.1 hypothetical protein [Bacteroidota bacterium]MBU2508095.1 hypothetical protein [Bacteroidota bacterium]
MNKSEILFNKIADTLTASDFDIVLGKMMSSPGLQYKKKVFAFYYKEMMVFKLGKDYNPGKNGIDDYSLLSPFKNKAPLVGCFEIPEKYSSKWNSLAIIALNKMKKSKT